MDDVKGLFQRTEGQWAHWQAVTSEGFHLSHVNWPNF